MNSETAIVALALVVLPGVGISLALFPGRALRLATRLASVITFGYCAISLEALVLAAAGKLTEGWFLGLYGVAAVAAWVIAGWRGRWYKVRPRRPGRPPAPGWANVLGLAGLAAIGIYHWTLSPYLQFGVSTPWRYWADGLEIAQAHDIPKDTFQWGAIYAETVSKIAFNTFDAAQSLALGTTSLQAMAALTWLGAIGVYLALWATADELGLGWTAPLLPILLLAAPGTWPLPSAVAQDALLFRAEDFGRLLALSAFALAVHCLRERAGWVQCASAGVLLGVAAFVHLIPVLVVGAMLGLYLCVTRLSGLRIRHVAAGAVAIAGATLVTYGAVLAGTHGNLGLQGSTASYTSYRGVDPTAYFRSGKRIPLGGETVTLSAAHLVDDYVQRSLTVGSNHVGTGLVALAVVALVALASSLLLERRLASVVIIAAGLTVSLVLASMWFAHQYSLMIQSTFGERRLYDYSGLPAVLLVLVTAEVLVLRAARLHRAVAAGLVAVAGAAVLGASVSHTPALPRWVQAGKRAQSTTQVYNMVSSRVPCDARILPNIRTEGVFEAVTGRHSVLEGMSPYLRPEMLDRVLTVLGGAEGFFHHPVKQRSFLRAEHIDYVMSMPPKVPMGQYNHIYVAPGLSKVPGLQLVDTVHGVSLYRVAGAAHTVTGPDPPRTCSVAFGAAS
jgi:hypothetical protein